MAKTQRKPADELLVVEEAFRPGYIIVKTSTARGGVTYDRQQLANHSFGDGSDEKRLLTDIRRDNAQIVKESEALVKKGDHVLRTHCANTMFGWFCDAGALSEIQGKFAEIRLVADRLNRTAKEVGSARRVHVGFVAAKLVLDELAAEELASTIVGALRRYVQHLRAGEVKDVKDASGKIIKRDQVRATEIAHANLEKLAKGMARDQLVIALETVRSEKAKVLRGLEDGLEPEEAGKLADVESLENAIFYFDRGLLV